MKESQQFLQLSLQFFMLQLILNSITSELDFLQNTNINIYKHISNEN